MSTFDGLPIIDDSTSWDVLFPPNVGTGLDLSERPEGFAYAGTAEPFPDELLIPASDWRGIIEEQKATRSRLVDLIDDAGVTVKDQQQTNYCWINAPTHCVEIVRARQGQRYVPLSAASAGAQITNYRNVGGWGKTGLEWIAKNGVVPEAQWPRNAISPRYATPENRQLALNYRVDEWWELPVRSLPHLVSCVLRGWPASVGYNWWRHQVTMVGFDWVDGEVVGIIDNSWGPSWGQNGRGILRGTRILPDDVTAPRVAKAS
jgi:hypothetical protein